MAVSGKMGRFGFGEPSNGNSGHDAVNSSSFDYDEYECFVVKGNATPATCINGTISGHGRFPQMDYYYYADDAGWDFLDIYYSTTRFAVETTMAFLAMILNVLEDQNCQGKTRLS